MTFWLGVWIQGFFFFLNFLSYQGYKVLSALLFTHTRRKKKLIHAFPRSNNAWWTPASVVIWTRTPKSIIHADKRFATPAQMLVTVWLLLTFFFYIFANSEALLIKLTYLKCSVGKFWTASFRASRLNIKTPYSKSFSNLISFLSRCCLLSPRLFYFAACFLFISADISFLYFWFSWFSVSFFEISFTVAFFYIFSFFRLTSYLFTHKSYFLFLLVTSFFQCILRLFVTGAGKWDLKIQRRIGKAKYSFQNLNNRKIFIRNWNVSKSPNGTEVRIQRFHSHRLVVRQRKITGFSSLFNWYN